AWAITLAPILTSFSWSVVSVQPGSAWAAPVAGGGWPGCRPATTNYEPAARARQTEDATLCTSLPIPPRGHLSSESQPIAMIDLVMWQECVCHLSSPMPMVASVLLPCPSPRHLR